MICIRGTGNKFRKGKDREGRQGRPIKGQSNRISTERKDRNGKKSTRKEANGRMNKKQRPTMRTEGARQAGR